MALGSPEKTRVLSFDRAVRRVGQRNLTHARPVPPKSVDDSEIDRFVGAGEVERWIRHTFIDRTGPLHNPDHAHLEAARLGVLWTNKPYRKQQRVILATAEDPKGGTQGAWKKGRGEQQLEEWFGTVPDFVITLYAPRLKDFDDRSFCAVIEHELYHAAQDTDEFGQPKWHRDGSPMFAIKGHDIEEFHGVAARYGLPADLKALLELAQQQPALPDRIIEGACGTCMARAA